jgi:hypothetical protein
LKLLFTRPIQGTQLRLVRSREYVSIVRRGRCRAKVGRIQNCFNNFEAPSLILSPDRKFGRVCKAIWPTKTAENLAARIGCQQLTLAACPGAQNADPAVGIHCRVAQAALSRQCSLYTLANDEPTANALPLAAGSDHPPVAMVRASNHSSACATSRVAAAVVSHSAT